MNLGPFKLESPALPSELPWFGHSLGLFIRIFEKNFEERARKFILFVRKFHQKKINNQKKKTLALSSKVAK